MKAEIGMVQNKCGLMTGLLLLGLALALAGCGRKSDAGEHPDKIGAGQLEQAFSAASTTQKDVVQKAEAYFKAQDYGSAYDLLQRFSKDTTLTAEQTLAISNALMELGNYPRRAP